MSVNRGIGILRFKLPEQGKHSFLLLGHARILMSLAIGGLAPDVADAYAVGIMPLAMSANLLDGTASVDASVSVYHIVIADSPEASVLVPSRDVRNSIVAASRRIGTMDDDFIDCSHCSSSFSSLPAICCSFFCSEIFCEANMAPTPSIDAVSSRN